MFAKSMIDTIIETFCRERGITPTEFCNPKRKSNVWITRYMIWHYLHYTCGMSANRLAKHFKRNRPSIFRGIRIIKHQFRYHKGLCAEYHAIVKKLEDVTAATPSENICEEKN